MEKGITGSSLFLDDQYPPEMRERWIFFSMEHLPHESFTKTEVQGAEILFYFFLQLLNYPLIEENILLVSVSTSGPWALWGTGCCVPSAHHRTGTEQGLSNYVWINRIWKNAEPGQKTMGIDFPATVSSSIGKSKKIPLDPLS